MTFTATAIGSLPSQLYIPSASPTYVPNTTAGQVSATNNNPVNPTTSFATLFPTTTSSPTSSTPASTAPTTTTTPSGLDLSGVGATDASGNVTSDSSLTSGDLAYLSDQASQLQDLLNRTSTGLDQGLASNDAQYQEQLNQAADAKAQQYNTYADDRTTQNQDKLAAYDTIDQNANQGYNSLAQLIGRSAGTGSSAYQELLPEVVGTDTSTKRAAASTTFGQNLANIQNNQNNYDLSYQDTLDDLANQKKQNEDTLRSGIETQRQSINQQLEDNAAQVAEANGGGASAVAAAEAPYQTAITNSRNAVDSFFSQFQPTYTSQPAVATPVNLADYTTDSSMVNAAADPTTTDSDNPYESLLLKKLQQTNAS